MMEQLLNVNSSIFLYMIAKPYKHKGFHASKTNYHQMNNSSFILLIVPIIGTHILNNFKCKVGVQSYWKNNTTIANTILF